MNYKKIELSIEQTDAFDTLTQTNGVSRLLYGGQAGGGKSFLICLWQIHQRLNYPGTRGYIGRTVLKRLKESVLVTFFDVANNLGVAFTYNDNKSHIDFPNGSRIVLLDCEYKPSDPNLDSLGSVEFTDGAIEEGVQVNKRVADILLTRTRYKHHEFGLEKKQLITCNPSDGWVKDEIIIPHFEGLLLPKNKFISASLDTNPDKEFVKSYKQTLEELDDEFDRSRLLHGDWFSQPKTGGEFYKRFEEKNNVSNIAYNPELPLHLTFDFNVNPYMTLLVHQLDGKHLKQINEICLETPRNTTAGVCKEFIYQYGEHQNGVFVYGDPAGKHEDTRTEKGHNDYTIIETELAKFSPTFRVSKSAPSIVMRGNFINRLFENRIEGCTFTIDRECSKTVSDYTQVKEDMDGKKKKTKVKNPRTGVTYEKYGHCSDANDYLICSVFSDEYNAFIRGNREVVRTLSTNSKTLRF